MATGNWSLRILRLQLSNVVYSHSFIDAREVFRKMKGGSNRKIDSQRSKPMPASTVAPLAPAELSDAGRVQFVALLAALPDGLAAPSDSTSLAILAELLAEFWRSPTEFPANRLNPVRGLLAEFGLTLAARRRLEIAPVEQENPFASIGRKP